MGSINDQPTKLEILLLTEVRIGVIVDFELDFFVMYLVRGSGWVLLLPHSCVVLTR